MKFDLAIQGWIQVKSANNIQLGTNTLNIMSFGFALLA